MRLTINGAAAFRPRNQKKTGTTSASGGSQRRLVRRLTGEAATDSAERSVTALLVPSTVIVTRSPSLRVSSVAGLPSRRIVAAGSMPIRVAGAASSLGATTMPSGPWLMS